MLVYLVIYDSGQVSLEPLLLSWYTSQRLSRPIAFVVAADVKDERPVSFRPMTRVLYPSGP